MTTNYYILKGKEVVRAGNVLEWAAAYEGRWKVSRTYLTGHLVSTVFLGLDHNFSNEGPPLLFETVVFKLGDYDDLDRARCTTWEQANAQHKAMCEKWQAKIDAGEVAG